MPSVCELSKGDIDELHANLARSYQCDIGDIAYNFARITDTADDDINKYIRLIFYMIDSNREIFNIKMLIPDEIQQLAVMMTKLK